MCQRAFGKEGDQDDKLGSPRWVSEGGKRGRKRGRISRAVRTLQGEAEGTGEVWGLERGGDSGVTLWICTEKTQQLL